MEFISKQILATLLMTLRQGQCIKTEFSTNTPSVLQLLRSHGQSSVITAAITRSAGFFSTTQIYVFDTSFHVRQVCLSVLVCAKISAAS